MTPALLLAGVLGVSIAGTFAAAVVGLPVLFAAVTAVSYACAAVLEWRYRRVAGWLHSRLLLGHGMQSALRQIAALVLVLHAGMPEWAVGWLLGGFLALQLLRPVFVAVSGAVGRRRRLPVAWRNIDIPSLVLPPPVLPWLVRDGMRRIYYLDLLPLAGVVGWELGAPAGAVAVLAALAVVLAVVLVGAVLVDRLRLLGRPSDDEVRRTVREAVERLAPRVVAYFSSRSGTHHLLDVWLSSYERLDQPTIIFMREPSHLDRIAPTRLPILVVPEATDLEYFRVPSIKVALYSTNTLKNNQLVRIPGIKDVFVGHGDSDKGSSFNPLSRMYDEVWVAGPAGRERYLRADVGVRDDQIREVGRPQLVEVRQAGARVRPAERPTVLYAPTWEGADRTLEYSSLARMGTAIVSGLLAATEPAVRVLFKPHPGTGHKLPEYAAACEQVRALVLAAGGDHAVVEGTEGLYAAFNEADLLVTDISSVITDFLYSGKPYIVTNPGAEDPERFLVAFPSAAGAYLLGPDCAGLADMVRDALGPDSMSRVREEVATYLLGDIHTDPVRRFNDAVAELIARQLAEDAQVGYPPGWYDQDAGERAGGADGADGAGRPAGAGALGTGSASPPTPA